MNIYSLLNRTILIVKTLLRKIKILLTDGILHILTGSILSKIASMFSAILVVRIADKFEYAYFAYADNIYSYIGLMTGFGTAVAILKYCSTSNNDSLSKAYLKFALIFGMVFDLLLAIILCIGISFIELPFPESRVFILIMVLLPPLNHCLSVAQSFSRAKIMNRQYALMGVIQVCVAASCSIGFVYFFGMKGSVAARYVAVTVALVYGLKIVKQLLIGVDKVELSRHQKKAFLSMSGMLMIANVFSMMIPVNEAFLINNLIKNANDVANYKISSYLPSQIFLVSNAIIIYFFPIISRMNNGKEILKKSLKAEALVFVSVVTISAIGYIFTPLIIKILYGVKYVDATAISRMLWLVYGLNAAIRVFPGNMMPAIGRVGYNMIISIGSCVVHLVIDYYMILYYGIWGIAYASIIVYAVSSCISWGLYFRSCLSLKEANM